MRHDQMQSETLDALGVRGSCQCCDEPGVAYWDSGGEKQPLEICASCAHKILPVLFADAVEIGPPVHEHHVAGALRTFEADFWRAVALRILRDRHQERPAATG